MFKVLVMGICAGSTPAGNWRMFVSTALTSDDCWRSEKHRITVPGFAQGAVKKWWRICSTSLCGSWRKGGEQTTRACFWIKKVESRAGRYTFVWRKIMKKQLGKAKEQIRREMGLLPATLQAYLEELATGIAFVHGSSRRKSSERKKRESLPQLLERWERYREML